MTNGLPVDDEPIQLDENEIALTDTMIGDPPTKLKALSATRMAIILASNNRAIEMFSQIFSEVEPAKDKSVEQVTGELVLTRYPQFFLEAIVLAYICTAKENELIPIHRDRSKIENAAAEWGDTKLPGELIDLFGQAIVAFMEANRAQGFEIKHDGSPPDPNGTTPAGSPATSGR